MSTLNHTDTAVDTTGEMVSADVTVPDGALDAAIGDRGTLTTADASAMANNITLVQAIRRNLTKLNVISDTDGTLVAGAVDVPAVLASNVVTNAKIVDATINLGTKTVDLSLTGGKIAPSTIDGTKITASAFNVPNGIWDPQNIYVDPVIADEPGGKLYWFPRTQAALDAVVTFGVVGADASNPFAGRTATLLGTGSGQWGKFVDISKAGWPVGSVVNGSVLVKPASAGGTWSLRCRCYKADGTVTSGTICNGVGFDFSTNSGAMRALTTVPGGGGGLTIEPLTQYVLFFTQHTSQGTGPGQDEINLSTYGWNAWSGDYGGGGYANTQYPFILDDLASARGDFPTITARLDNFLPENDVYGRHFLHDWPSQIAKINAATAGTKAIIGWFGDSWTLRDYSRNVLRSILQTAYGDAGAGWVGFGQHLLHTTAGYRNGFTLASTGTWNSVENTAACLGPEPSHTVSSGTGGTITLATTGATTDIYLYYYRQTGGGSFTWAIDGGGATTVSTAGTAGIQSVAITGLSSATHTLVVTATVAGSTNVTLLGADLQKSGIGVRVHKFGAAGSDTVDWTDVEPTQWQAVVTALGINVAIFQLGTNDAQVAHAVTSSMYGANLQTLKDRVRAALPLVDVIFLPSADNSVVSIAPYDTAAQAAALTSALGTVGVAYLSSYKNVGDYTSANTRGLYEDTLHIGPLGGRQIAELLYNRLLKVA